MKSERLRIFVGSSTEAASIDLQVRKTLEEADADVIGWRDLFRPGDHPLEVLMEAARVVDGALLIATPDDRTLFRGEEHLRPRDNIIFELGIFLSQLGRHRAALVLASSKGEVPSLPSDLYGITALRFEPEKRASSEARLKDWVSGVRQDPAVAHPASAELRALLRQTLVKMPRAWHTDLDRFVLANMREAIQLAGRGHVLLSPGQYYAELYSEMEQGFGTNHRFSGSNAFLSLLVRGPRSAALLQQEQGSCRPRS